MGRRRKSRHDLPQRVYQKHGAFYFVDRTGTWHHLGRDFATAMVKYGELNSGPGKITKMAHVIDRYQREILPTKALGTQKTNIKELALLRHAFGHMQPDEVTPRDIYQYMDARQAPIRANREKALLSHVMGYAIRWGVADGNPCRLVKGNPERPRKRYVSDAEFWGVYEIAPKMIQAAMKLALLTGLRQGDILRLRYQDMTDEGLQVETGKTGRRLVFEWTAELRGAIEQATTLPRPVRGIWLLCNRQGQRYSSSGFQSIWQRLMRKAIEKGVIGERFTFHDIRAKAGSDSEDGKLLGHEDPRTLQRHYKRKPLRVTPLSPKILDK